MEWYRKAWTQGHRAWDFDHNDDDADADTVLTIGCVEKLGSWVVRYLWHSPAFGYIGRHGGMGWRMALDVDTMLMK